MTDNYCDTVTRMTLCRIDFIGSEKGWFPRAMDSTMSALSVKKVFLMRKVMR